MGFLDDLKHTADELGDKAKEGFEAAKDKVSDFAEDVKDKAGDIVDDVKDRFDGDDDEPDAYDQVLDQSEQNKAAETTPPTI